MVLIRLYFSGYINGPVPRIKGNINIFNECVLRSNWTLRLTYFWLFMYEDSYKRLIYIDLLFIQKL